MVQKSIVHKVGNTPLINLRPKGLEEINLFAKLEMYNPSGSVKDRAASYIINKLLDQGEINKDTTIIESSSGNFGIALSTYCKYKGLKFICVVDPLISSVNELIIKNICSSMIKVHEIDKNGGYLLNRIKKVEELLETIDNAYWINQYANPYNAEAYYNTLGKEMCDEVSHIDYVFLGVSSGGTITGVSQKVKDVYPDAKIIAVDIKGSVIFGGPPEKRYIPGIGSSKVPDILQFARIDEIMTINEATVVNSCHELLKEHMTFVGGSSGAVFAAIKQYFAGRQFKEKPNVVTIFADRGDRYANTVYNKTWCDKYIFKSNSDVNLG